MVHQVPVVVEPPHAELARRLELEPGLHLADQGRVVGKDAPREGGLVGRRDEADAAQDEEVSEERELVAGAVVEALGRAECGGEVTAQLGEGDGVARVDDEGAVQVGGGSLELVEPGEEGGAARSRGGARVGLLDPRRGVGEEVDDELDGLRASRGASELGERDEGEEEEVGAPWREARRRAGYWRP